MATNLRTTLRNLQSAVDAMRALHQVLLDRVRERHQGIMDVIEEETAINESLQLRDLLVGVLASDDFTGATQPQGAPPATMRSLSRLPRSKVMSSGVECSVCQEDLPRGATLITLPCKHYFCSNCIESWLKLHRTCPNCRLEVEEPPESSAESTPIDLPLPNDANTIQFGDARPQSTVARRLQETVRGAQANLERDPQPRPAYFGRPQLPAPSEFTLSTGHQRYMWHVPRRASSPSSVDSEESVDITPRPMPSQRSPQPAPAASPSYPHGINGPSRLHHSTEPLRRSAPNGITSADIQRIHGDSMRRSQAYEQLEQNMMTDDRVGRSVPTQHSRPPSATALSSARHRVPMPRDALSPPAPPAPVSNLAQQIASRMTSSIGSVPTVYRPPRRSVSNRGPHATASTATSRSQPQRARRSTDAVPSTTAAPARASSLRGLPRHSRR